MTLTTNNKYVPFTDYYNSLVCQEPTEHERFLALIREEIGVRKRLETEEQRHFTDVLHVAGVFVGDKKFRLGIGKRAAKAAEEEQHRKVKEAATRPRAADGSLIPGSSMRVSMPPTTRRAMAVRAVEEAVWFPASEPHAVDPPRRALVPGYPYRAVNELFEEEAELRRWLCGVEARLRQQMDEECNHDLYIALRLKEIEALEKRGRSRLERDQVEAFSTMRNQVFYLAPPEYFRKLVVSRFGASQSGAEEKQRDLSFAEKEAAARDAIATEEQAAFEKLFDYLHDAYDLQLFTANHLEFVERENILQEERDDCYPMMLDSARGTYGLLYDHSPAVFLNMSTARAAAPLMHDMVMRFKTTMDSRAAEAHRTLHSSNRAAMEEASKLAAAERAQLEATVAAHEDEEAKPEAAAAEKEQEDESADVQERDDDAPPITMDAAELDEPASPPAKANTDGVRTAAGSPSGQFKYMSAEQDEYYEL